MTATPEALRDAGMDAATYAADSRVVAIIDALIALENESGREWSANSIRSQVPACSPGLVGSRVKAAWQRGEMVHVMEGCEACGTRTPKQVPSSLRSTKGKPIYVYRGVAS